MVGRWSVVRCWILGGALVCGFGFGLGRPYSVRERSVVLGCAAAAGFVGWCGSLDRGLGKREIGINRFRYYFFLSLLLIP